MSIYKELNNELKQAMKSKDENTKKYIRILKSRVSEYLVANNIDRNVDPSDEVVSKVILSYKKSLEKAIMQFYKGGEKSCALINEYNDEIEFCSKYLPNNSQLKENINIAVDCAIKELNANIKQIGKVIGYIMKNNKDFDGRLVKEIVKDKLMNNT